MNFKSIAIAAAALGTSVSPALANANLAPAQGLLQGLSHPLLGIDHLLVMVAVGALGVRMGGRAIYAVPAAFVAVMILGATLGANGFALPMVETAIGLSVVALGGALVFGTHLNTIAAMALVGICAVFHGHAHGAEMPLAASGLSYGLGFVAATAALHAVGLGLGLTLPKFKKVVHA